MSSSRIDLSVALGKSVQFSKDALIIELTDGRTLSVPLAWYPRLNWGTEKERSNWELIGHGEGIHWPDLDEDLAIEDMLAGRRSGESSASLQRWLAQREGR
jgi:hypothetical protein